MSSEKSSQGNQRLSIYTLDNFNSTSVLTENGRSGEYNPFEHRNKHHANSTMGSLAHIMKCSLGAGILAIPMAFKNSGLLFGAIGTLIVGLICTHCVQILVKTSRGVCRRAKVPALDFAGTAEKVFETGPPGVRKYAYFAKAFCEYGMSATYLGVDCVLIVLIATSIGQVINNALDIEWGVRTYIALTVVPCIIIGEIRQLKYLVPFSAIANLCLVVTFGITLYYMVTGPMPIQERPLFSSWSQLPLYFSTVIFAMEGIGAIMPVENSMQKPEYFLYVLNTAMFVVVFLYISIGFLGYVRFGDAVKASITMNLPEDEFAAKLAQILIGIATLFTFGLQFYVPMDILWRKISSRISKDKHNISQIFIRGGTIVILGAISAAVPKLDPFIGLVGAIFFSSLGLLAPAVIETVFRYPDDFGVGNWILIKNIFLVVFSLLAISTGSFVSIQEIIHIYTKPE